MHPPIDLIDLTLALMRIDSTSGREGEVVHFAQTTLESLGWSVRRIAVSAGRENIYASVSDARLSRRVASNSSASGVRKRNVPIR